MADNYIEKLLDAERKATQIVREAQIEREKRLQEARRVAENELKEYRNEEERNYQEFVKSHQSGNENDEIVQTRTKKEIEQINSSYTNHKKEVSSKLLDQIFKIDTTIPQTVINQFKKKKF